MPKPDRVPEVTTEHQASFAASGHAQGPGRFDILCITAGNGNGWDFTSGVLKDSLALWEGAHCFIDHHWQTRSLRDLAGQVIHPYWDDQAQGIRATLKAFGPGGPLLTAFASEVLSEGNPYPLRVGFSADLLFKAKGKKIEKILRIISLDLVYDPARGGAFLRALNSLHPPYPPVSNPNSPNPHYQIPTTQLEKDNLMQKSDETTTTPEPIEEPTASKPEEGKIKDKDEPILKQLQLDQAAMRNMLEEHERQEQLNKALEEARVTRVAMCDYLLDSALASSKLPKPVQERIRKQFKGSIFDAPELNAVIHDNREMLSELSATYAVNGPSRIESMFDERDKLQAAVDDLLDAPRGEDLKGVTVPRLSGIRELYLMLTGDYDLHGGYHPDRVQMATTADFTGLVKNALNKIVVSSWQQLGRAGYDWWQSIVTQEHFNSIQDITGTLIGTVGDLPVVAEGAEYQELLIGDSPEVAQFRKYGGYIPLTLELIDRDQTRKLKAYARELGSAGIRKVSRLVSEIFTANAGTGPVMADTGALFNATAVTTAGGHANLLTTALSIAAWDAACTAVYNQPMLIKNQPGLYGTGPKMALNPKFCLVPRTLQNTAWQMLTGSFVREATFVYDNVLKGSAVPITVPEWTDADDWAAACDPNVAPAIFVGDRFGIMPEVYVAGDELSPAVFMNDEHRLKVRHFLAVWVNDFRPLHKSNV